MLLPDPDAPVMATNCPCSTSMSTRRTAITPASAAEEIDHAARVLGIERPCRFVGQDDRRPRDQRPGDGTALLLAAGQGVGAVTRAVTHADRLEGAQRRGVAFGRRSAVEHEGQADVLHERQLREEVVSLEDESDPAPPDERQGVVTEGREVDPFEEDAARGGTRDAAEEVEEGALSGSRRAGDGDELPSLHGQVDAADGRDARLGAGGAEGLFELFDTEDRHGARPEGAGSGPMYPNPRVFSDAARGRLLSAAFPSVAGQTLTIARVVTPGQRRAASQEIAWHSEPSPPDC